MIPRDREAWITGIGLVSSLGEGCDATWQGLMAGRPKIDEASFAPYPVHRLAAVDFAKQIPKSEQRLMDAWQRTGTYAAGLALDSAGIKACAPVLAHTDLVVVAGGGERDTALDCTVLTESRTAPDGGRLLNEKLMSDLRPTLFLSQLSNMLAGNISIIHGVTGSSRTFLGEAAGIEAVRTARARVVSGQSDIVLVGGAHSGERKDLLLFCESGGLALKGEYAPVFERQARGGGITLGSFGAFLVIESKAHASARGGRPLARLAAVVSNRAERAPGGLTRSFSDLWGAIAPHASCGRLAVLSGASGAEPTTSEERAFFATLGEAPVRVPGSYIGYGFETQFSVSVAVAALVASNGTLFPAADGFAADDGFADPIDTVLVTGAGHRRGEGLALVERIHHA
jgi:3-oxoacyl-[acyl-carrier-protein] synthase II